MDANITLERPFPVLYHKGSKGDIRQWQVWTEGADIVTEHGQHGGKLQIARKTATAKNIGKANETSPVIQAKLECEAMYTHKLTRKYSLSIVECEERMMLPMLAHSFEKKKHKVEYPVFVQPKLDGVRCLARVIGFNDDGTSIVQLLTRGGKQWDIPHLALEISELLPQGGMVLDGEIYLHGKTFQEISKLVKKARPETKDLEYHIYDIPMFEAMDGEDEKHDHEAGRVDQPFSLRLLALNGIASEIEHNKLAHLKVVSTIEVSNEQGVYALQSQMLEDGYEGAIVRSAKGVYKFGYRSPDLLKVKTFLDDEYKIVGFHAGIGKFETCVIWECVTKDGEPFNCVPRGTFEDRREWLENGDKHVGKLLKVTFFEYTDDGLPRFPVGIGFRLSEDI